MNWIKKIDIFFSMDSFLYVIIFALISLFFIIFSFYDQSLRWPYLIFAVFGLARTWRHLVLWNQKRDK